MINLGTINKTGAGETKVKTARSSENQVKIDAAETTKAVKPKVSRQDQNEQKKQKRASAKQKPQTIKAEPDTIYDQNGKKSPGSKINISI